MLIQYANGLLKHKILFGSDDPLLTPDRWLADFEKIAIKGEVRPLILKENAMRLFGLGRLGHPPETTHDMATSRSASQRKTERIVHASSGTAVSTTGAARR
jgi:Amidohydrolase